MKTAITLITASMLAGCVGHAATRDGIARAGISETVHVDGPKVTPVALLEDSRCAKGVQCVWAGRVRISAKVELGSGTQTHEMTLGQPIQVADGKLTLVDVKPEATAGRTIPPQDYRFGFTFAGGL